MLKRSQPLNNIIRNDPFISKTLPHQFCQAKNIKLDDRSFVDEEKKLNKKVRKLKNLEKAILDQLANEEISTDEYLTIYNKAQESLHSLERKLKHNKDTLNYLKEEIFYKQNDIDQFLIMHKNTEKIEVDLLKKKILVIEYLNKK